jgi:hypothetical protein
MAKCRVSYTNEQGVHSVEVTADTLFEAVALAVAEFRDDKTVAEPPGPETEFSVSILRKPVEHFIRLRKVLEWAQPSSRGGPAEMVRREKVRKVLAL